MVFVGAGLVKNQGNGSPTIKAAQVQRGIGGMGGVGGGGNVAHGPTGVGPDNLGTGGDSERLGIETGGSEGNTGFLGGDRVCGGNFLLLNSFGGGGDSVGRGAFFAQEEVVNGGVDEDSDDGVEGKPLPEGALGVSGGRLGRGRGGVFHCGELITGEVFGQALGNSPASFLFR